MSAYIAECPLCGEAKKEAAEDLVAFVVHIRRCHNKALSEMREKCAKVAENHSESCFTGERGEYNCPVPDRVVADVAKKIRAEVTITG